MLQQMPDHLGADPASFRVFIQGETRLRVRFRRSAENTEADNAVFLDRNHNLRTCRDLPFPALLQKHFFRQKQVALGRMPDRDDPACDG